MFAFVAVVSVSGYSNVIIRNDDDPAFIRKVHNRAAEIPERPETFFRGTLLKDGKQSLTDDFGIRSFSAVRSFAHDTLSCQLMT